MEIVMSSSIGLPRADMKSVLVYDFYELFLLSYSFQQGERLLLRSSIGGRVGRSLLCYSLQFLLHFHFILGDKQILRSEFNRIR